MRIAFDGTTLRPGRTGVGYYTEHLLQHLAREAAGHEITVISNRPVDTTVPLPPSVRVLASSTRIPRMVWMQTLAPRMVRQLRADIVHFTNGMVPFASTVPTVVTIHDMSLTLLPQYHPPRRVFLNRPLVDLAARRSTRIITVSESSKRDIVRLYRLDPQFVQVVHEAAAPAFRRVTDAVELDRVRRRYQLRERIILYVGTIEPRKNLPLLIEGFARRRNSGELPHQLVCVGPYGWLSRDIEDLIERLNVEDAIQFTGYVPFEELPALYSLAEMFVFPSIYEGFGLPVIEAMACGTPVITGNVAALAEIAGQAVEHVDRPDADTLGAAMVALANNRVRREQLAAHGVRRARTFSWARAARETLKIYWQAVSGEAAAPAAVPAAYHSSTP